MQAPNRYSSGAVDPNSLSPQLKELYINCVQMTKHPESGADILRFIKSVTASKHLMDKFQNDLGFFELELTASATSRSIEANLLPLHRQIMGIATHACGTLDFIGINDALRMQLGHKTNCWYRLGQAVHIKTRAPHSKILFAYLGKPDISDAHFYSWIAAEYPFAIQDEVAGLIAGIHGETERQQVYSNRVRQIHDMNLLREQLLLVDVIDQQLADYRRNS